MIVKSRHPDGIRILGTRVFLSCVLFICAAAHCFGQVNKEFRANTKSGENDAIARRVDDFLTAAGATGGVLIAKNGKVILRKGYGWANEDTQVPMTTRTVFDIGSVTKQFTGAAILKLEEQGKLKVTDQISKFFKDVPADKQNITIHHLLTHTAGFEADVVDRTEFPTRDECVRRMLDSRLKLIPGEKYSYSNAGYALLAAIVEIASGTSYENHLNKYLWKPARMLKTGFIIPRYKTVELARSYDISGDSGISQEKWWGKDGPSWGVRGAGYVLSTLEDLYLWHKALEGDKVLSKSSKEKYFASHVPENSKGSSHYGYGWATFSTPRKTRLIAHDGYNSLFFTNFQRFVDEDMVIIYFTSEARTVARQIFNFVDRAAFGTKLPDLPKPAIRLTPSELQKYAGTYELPSGVRFTLDKDKNNLLVKTTSIGAGRLLTTFPKPEDSERIRDVEDRTKKIIESIARGDITSSREALDLEVTFEEERAYWKQKFDDWTGRFGEFEEAEVIGSFTEKNRLITYVLLKFHRGATTVQFRENTYRKFAIGIVNSILPRHYRLVPLSNTEFAAYNYALQTSTQVRFILGENNTVTGLTIHDKREPTYLKKIVP